MTTAEEQQNQPIEQSVVDQIREIVKTGHAIGLLVSAKKAAALLDTTEKTLADWRRVGRGPKFVANEGGRFMGYRLARLETYLMERECQSLAEARTRRDPSRPSKRGRKVSK